MKILFLFGVIAALQVQVLARNVPINTRTYGNFGPNTKHFFKMYGTKGIFWNQTVHLVADAIEFLMAETRSTEQSQVLSYHTSADNGVTHTYFQQIVNGLQEESKWHCQDLGKYCEEDLNCCSRNCRYVNPTTGWLCFKKF